MSLESNYSLRNLTQTKRKMNVLQKRKEMKYNANKDAREILKPNARHALNSRSYIDSPSNSQRSRTVLKS